MNVLDKMNKDNIPNYFMDESLIKEITELLRIFHNIPLNLLSEYLIKKEYSTENIFTAYSYLKKIGNITYESDFKSNYIIPAMLDDITNEESYISRAAFCIYNKIGDMEKKMIAPANFPFDYEFVDKNNEPCFLKVLIEGKTEMAIDFIALCKSLKKYYNLILVKSPELNLENKLEVIEHSYTMYTFDGNNKILSITNHKNPKE